MKDARLVLDNGADLQLGVATSFFDRFMGYMGQSSPRYDGIMFPKCQSIHTAFMKFNIDVYFLKNNQIVSSRLNFPPWRVSFPVFAADSVLEIPHGKIDPELIFSSKLEVIFV